VQRRVLPVRLAANIVRGRRNHAFGEHCQNLAQSTLQRMGFAMVERVHTPFRLHRVGGRITGASPVEKVSGDLRAVAPGGRSVLAEVKNREERLVWSEIDKHQVAALDHHADVDGRSLLIWVRLRPALAIDVLDWAILRAAGFGPRAVLTPGCDLIAAAVVLAV